MEIQISPSRYVVAVSGGVDSVALLHVLAGRPGLQLTVAHFDHGIREGSASDRRFVQALAKTYGLPFVYQTAKLGPHASEATAREARYDFLHRTRLASRARAIITAHHADDVLETAILNILRGTGSRGLSSLKSTDVVKRPLLHISKQELQDYAIKHQLDWREDSTNTDERYLRNYIRHRIVPRLGSAGRQDLESRLAAASSLNAEIAASLAHVIHIQPAADRLNRSQFIMLPHSLARELMAEWLRCRAGTELTTRLLERLVTAAKTGRSGTKTDIDARHWLEIHRDYLALIARKR